MDKSMFMYLKSRTFMLLIMFITAAGCTTDKVDDVNNAEQARAQLEEERAQVQSALNEDISADNLQRLIDLGQWQQVQRYLDEAEEQTDALRLVEARLLVKKHRYKKAEQKTREVLDGNPKNRKAKLIQAELHIQAWRLQKAQDIADELLDANNRDAEAGLIRGRVALLERSYDEALQWARHVQEWDGQNAGGHLLEAETQFWNQKPEVAESALVRALELDPYNTDARFSYGYAIWRRVDATQLDKMAAQWNLAFETNPLHYLTHWHFGNGHTNLTYTDYAHPSDSLVRARLKVADSLIDRDEVGEAITVTRDIESEYPASVLPAMMRGSAFYMHYGLDRSTRLDSAQTIFESILERKQNYGPAHNGLAAVIKQRQFKYLDGYEELEVTIEEPKIPNEEDVFYEVFKDAEYYPGDRVKKMIARQIGPSRAYLPMVNKFGSNFAIPPLHVDLSEAMESNYFRHGTTFDNRQWMDIRGVGSGATGIEYLERGAHWERNVLAHEYAHLYHGRILTDHESRRIRALYHAAMEHDRTLDYYASNNESEFFAQGYAGFLSEQKVHPLNHKSMNTREYIQKTDSVFYVFLDSLIRKQQEYLSGNTEVLNDNWAQTHLTLAEQSRRNGSLDQAAAYLDTALTFSADYLPALLEYAELHSEEGDFDAAEEKTTKAVQLDENYAPIYVTEANIAHEKVRQGVLSADEGLEEQISFFDDAYKIENDLAERARINRLYRNRLYDYGHIAQAIEEAEQYIEGAPTISTYLRDRKEEAQAYVNDLRSSLGYSEEVVDDFKNLVDQNPQNFGYRRMYADGLQRAGQPHKALRMLEEGQKILTSAREERPGYTLRIAQVHIINGDTSRAEQSITQLDNEQLDVEEQLLLAQIYGQLGCVDEAQDIIKSLDETKLPAAKAELVFVKGTLHEASGDQGGAAEKYRTALEENPYRLRARVRLIGLMNKADNEQASIRLREEGKTLDIPLGPDFDRLLKQIM